MTNISAVVARRPDRATASTTSRAHTLPPRARLTSEVVLKPGSTSTSITSPP
jgi:hypothetical protein